MRNLGLLQCFSYMQKFWVPSAMFVRNHVSVGNLTYKVTAPGVMLESGNGVSLTDQKWTGESGQKVSRSFQRLKYNRRIKAAVRVGTLYPEQNPQLAKLVEEIRIHDLDIPLKQVVEIAVNPKSRTGIHEVTGPGGILFVLQYESPDWSTSEHLVKEICSKYELSFVNETHRLAFYDQKGILMVTARDQMSPKEAVEEATRAGAELVASAVGSDEKLSLEVYCNPSNLHQLKRQLGNFTVEEAFVGFVPKILVTVPDSVISHMADAIVDFTKIPYIEMLYKNIK